MFNAQFGSKWERFSDLVCSPWDRSPLVFNAADSVLVDASGTRFPVWNGIPLISPVGLAVFSEERGLRDHVSLLGKPGEPARDGAPLYLDSAAAHLLATNPIDDGTLRALNLPEQPGRGDVICRNGKLMLFDGRWHEVELEVETRHFDRLAQQSHIQKQRVASEIVALLPLREPHLLHAGFTDPAVHEILARALTSWPVEALAAELLCRLTSRSPARGNRLAGVNFRDENESYFRTWLAAAGVEIGQTDALVWSSGAGYLSDILLSAGCGRVVNYDERLATLPALPDQGADELFVWADPHSNPAPDGKFRVVLSHRHTVASRMGREELGAHLKRMADACDAEGVCYVSINSDMRGLAQSGWANLTLAEIFASARTAGLRCAQFATIGVNLSFWFTRHGDVCRATRRCHESHRSIITRQSMDSLRRNQRERYFFELATYCCDAIVCACEGGMRNIGVVGDTVFDRDLRELLSAIPLPGVAVIERANPLKAAVLIGTGAVDPLFGRATAIPFHDAMPTGSNRAFPYHSGDGDSLIRPTADHYLR
jgi:hypothetical protein